MDYVSTAQYLVRIKRKLQQRRRTTCCRLNLLSLLHNVYLLSYVGNKRKLQQRRRTTCCRLNLLSLLHSQSAFITSFFWCPYRCDLLLVESRESKRYGQQKRKVMNSDRQCISFRLFICCTVSYGSKKNYNREGGQRVVALISFLYPAYIFWIFIWWTVPRTDPKKNYNREGGQRVVALISFLYPAHIFWVMYLLHSTSYGSKENYNREGGQRVVALISFPCWQCISFG